MIPLLTALGGALGSRARYWFSAALALATAPALPWRTLLVTVTSRFVIGVAAGGPIGGKRRIASPFVRHFAVAGPCGRDKTFSAFSLQTASMLPVGGVGRASLNAVASVATCLVAAWAGNALATALAR